MIDVDERPLRQSAEQTQRIWDRVAQGIAAERRRFRRHAFLAALAGGLIGAAFFGALFSPDESGDSDAPPPVVACETGQEPSRAESCP